MGMWRDSLWRILPIEFFPVKIRGAGLCRRVDHELHGCVMCSLIWKIQARLAWRLHGRWLDGSRRSTVARWTRRRAAPAFVHIPDRYHQGPLVIPRRLAALLCLRLRFGSRGVHLATVSTSKSPRQNTLPAWRFSSDRTLHAGKRSGMVQPPRIPTESDGRELLQA